jgi:acetyltransferase-like isoleucine patch superfamily enzyme
MIRVFILKLYIFFTILRYVFRKKIFNTEYANKLFLTINRDAIIPLLKYNKAKIGYAVKIDSPLIIHYYNDDLSKLTIGNNCSISKNCFLDLAKNIYLGDNCTLAMNVTIITHIDFGQSALCDSFVEANADVTIKNNTYIGANTTILKGVTIGSNCLIGAMSLVNKDIESNSIMGGIPAKPLKLNK